MSYPESLQVLTDYGCLPKVEADQSIQALRSNFMKRAECLFEGLKGDCNISFEGVLNRKASRLSLAPYPPGAHVTQQIDVYIMVDEFGRVAKANAPCGDQLLRQAAADAALQTSFKPMIVNGTPAPVYGFLIYRFVYQGR